MKSEIGLPKNMTPDEAYIQGIADTEERLQDSFRYIVVLDLRFPDEQSPEEWNWYELLDMDVVKVLSAVLISSPRNIYDVGMSGAPVKS